MCWKLLDGRGYSIFTLDLSTHPFFHHDTRYVRQQRLFTRSFYDNSRHALERLTRARIRSFKILFCSMFDQSRLLPCPKPRAHKHLHGQALPRGRRRNNTMETDRRAYNNARGPTTRYTDETAGWRIIFSTLLLVLGESWRTRRNDIPQRLL